MSTMPETAGGAGAPPRAAAGARRQPADRPDLRLRRAVRGHGHRQPGAGRRAVPHGAERLDDVPLRVPAGDDRGGADAGHADRRRRPLGRDDGDGRRVRGRLAGPERRVRRDRLRAWPSGSASGSSTAIGIGIFRVNPLVMTLGVSGVSLGMLTIIQRPGLRPGGAGRRENARLGAVLHLRAVERPGLGAGGGADHPRPALFRLRANAVRRRRQPARLPAGGRSRLAGARRRVRALAGC